jgi:cytochrome c-type biogenesis protein CcmH/NrfG
MESASSKSSWQSWQVYVMAAICLLIGVVVGYLARGSAAAPSATASAQTASASAAPASMPSLDAMKRMADKQAQPLLAKLKADPNNADLLDKVGSLYRVTHDFQTAISYYQKSLEINPKNVGARTDMASCMYYLGDADGAIAQLEKSLTYDPKHAGTLLNLGLIRWKGKGDAAGAVSAWQRLLKENPKFENRDAVLQLIANAKAKPAKALVGSE